MRDQWPLQTSPPMRMIRPAPELVVHTVLGYTPADPWAVAWRLADCCERAWDGDPQLWVFARDLLAAGIDGPAGIGAVQMWPHQGRVALRFASPNAVHILTVQRRPLAEFTTRTYAWVPRGEEPTYAGLDAAADRLLQAGGAG